MNKIILFFLGVLLIAGNCYGADIKLGEVHRDVLSSYAVLHEPSKWGESITVYLFSTKLSNGQIRALDHRGQTPIKAVLGFEQVMQINIGLDPRAGSGSLETLRNFVVVIHKSDTMPIPLKKTIPVNFPLKREQTSGEPVIDGIKSFQCELTDQGALSFSLENQYLFPSDIQYIDNVLLPGTGQLNFQWDLDISTRLRTLP